MTQATATQQRSEQAARLYWENWGKLGYFNAKGVSIPVAVSVFPDELYPAPRSWAERAYPKLIHYNKVEGRALRGLGTAATLFRRGSRGLQTAAQIVGQYSSQLPPRRLSLIALSGLVRHMAAAQQSRIKGG
jgi:hypothetical protein